MSRHNVLAFCAATILAAFSAHRADALTFATFDADQFNDNGFRFGDLNDDFFGTFDASAGVISLDVQNDFDMADGFFGGAGSDVAADFDSSTTQLEVVISVDPLNVASDFRVVLVDNDGPSTGEEYQFLVDLSGVTPGSGFVTLTQELLNPGPVFRQAAFGQADGDAVQNFGLSQIQIQTAFGSTDRLKVDIQSVGLVDPDAPEDPLVVELTPATFATAQSFDFGIFQDAGVVDQTSGNFVIDANQSPNPGDGGGLGFNGLDFDFDPTTHELQVEAKLLAGNQADSFNILLGDADGDDSGPGLGSEDFIFTVPTSEFTDTDFTTFTLPLGSGSESNLETTFGFTNGGDGLQNFDLSQLQIQMNADAEGDTGDGLAIEIVAVRVVAIQPVEGDYNGDGMVNAADYTVWRDSFGQTGTGLAADGNGDETVDILDYTLWKNSFLGGNAASAAAVPEPASALLGACCVGAVYACRRKLTTR